MRNRHDFSDPAGHVFSSLHYYWNGGLVLRRRTSRCLASIIANPVNGHGHNYTLEVTVAGEPDAVTGFVVDLKWLKDVMESQVVAAWDHSHLNLEVREFSGSQNWIPTTENMAIAAWDRLEPRINATDGARLSRVRIYETPEIFAEYRGEDGDEP